jgi:hypothetical protein
MLTQTQSTDRLQDYLMEGLTMLDDLAAKLGVEPEELRASLISEKVPFKAIGKKIFIRNCSVRTFILTPNFNNPKTVKETNLQYPKNSANDESDWFD